MLDVEGLTKEFNSGLFSNRKSMKAVDDVSFHVERGRIHGLIGGSGSGKTTLSRMIMGFIKPDAGVVRYGGRDLTRLSKKEWRSMRCDIQMVFQNPQKAFNPRATVYDVCAEPLRLFHRVESREQERMMVRDMLDEVGVTGDQMGKYPHEISGGQAQRISIIRALSLHPDLLICDEPTAMLDVSVQAQIIDLLRRINRERGTTLLFISHDLDVVRYLCDDVSVMDRGRVIESDECEVVFGAPRAAFTKELIQAAL